MIRILLICSLETPPATEQPPFEDALLVIPSPGRVFPQHLHCSRRKPSPPQHPLFSHQQALAIRQEMKMLPGSLRSLGAANTPCRDMTFSSIWFLHHREVAAPLSSGVNPTRETQ